MKRVLVTGIQGFVGRNLVQFCGDRYDFVGLDLANGVDLCDPSAFKGLTGDFDAAIHLAGLSFVPESFSRPHEYYRVNINASLAIAEFCRVKAIPVLIYPNTYVYGAPQKLPVDESHPIALPSPYHKSKKLAEDLLLSYFDAGQTQVVSLRVFNLYGPGQNPKFLIPEILASACREGRVSVRDLEPRRDFLYIADFISLLDSILSRSSLPSGVYNVGSGCSHSVSDVVATVEELLGRKLEVNDLHQRRKNEIMDCYADIQKVRAAFNWAPERSLRDGLSELLRSKTYV